MAVNRVLIVLGSLLLALTCILQIVIHLDGMVFIMLFGLSILIELVGSAMEKEEK